ncbi:MAG TPA: APC family permease [Blastocatellia bacterium]|nr:APC family permease [Blastocatellia bacterium]
MNRDATKTPGRIRVVVATSVMLSFISFWRAAAIVLNDLGSSAFYAGGIAEQAVGKAAPWFILAVMLFSYGVRVVYIESSSMFTRGGVYRVVKEAMGGTLAKLSVSALMFDYILTGPISGVSAGLYLAGLVNEVAPRVGLAVKLPMNGAAMLFALAMTLYFWRRNIKGLHESSADALRIMYVTTSMVVIMIVWGSLTLIERGGQLAPWPEPRNLSFAGDALGWLKPWRWFAREGDRYQIVAGAPSLIGLLGLLIAFGHSVLAMSGEETLAQVNRELESPKLKNLQRAGLVIFVYSLLFTSLVSFFAVAIIPDEERHKSLDNLIAGLAMNLMGPVYLKLIFHAFVVIVGFLMLSGAINTAIVGSNGVLNRVSEDGVLADWFRAPHGKYGTTHRIINLIVIFQVATIIGSRGNVYMLGEAYAFGVIWSFTFNAFATIVLRFKRREEQEWKVPGNIRVGGVEIPIGLGLIATILLSTALVNMLTKQVATVSGLAFTAIFFAVFTLSERVSRRKTDRSGGALDPFKLDYQGEINSEVVHARPGNVLVAVRNPQSLSHLERVLERTDTEEQDVVVMTVLSLTGPHSGERDLYKERLFTMYEQRLFTRVVAVAEKQGKPVELIVVPSKNVYHAIAQTAQRLDSARIVTGQSWKISAQSQARQLSRFWKRLPEKPPRRIEFMIIGPGRSERIFIF